MPNHFHGIVMIPGRGDRPVAPDPEIHHRRSIRLPGYDYSQPGAYFITLCTQNRECWFGEVRDEERQVNDVGWMVEKWWDELNNKFPVSYSKRH